MALLEVEAVDTYYGRVQALRGVSLTIDDGEIVTLIGSNGAGKTTTLRTISGLARPTRGRVRLRGADIGGLPPNRVVMRGIGHAPEGRRVFARMSVRDNLFLGAYVRKDAAGIRSDEERIFGFFPRLRERRNQIAGTLSGGEQQMLAIGRALMSRPKILLLDEPSLGLAPILVDTIFQVIREINSQGTTILLIEQNAAKALQVANRGYVLETGRIVQEGTAKALLESPDVQRAYLGI
ncbi:MAG TPA: ABC transporter ATP-binding protein [Candidatus Dormibacteraeota bacterium]|jgi:branched-chain amino acid transport system ATP-binding protein|nr:ABC transporter ATP-binding protein [Candidatus Dormibacteraeota bacterium]